MLSVKIKVRWNSSESVTLYKYIIFLYIIKAKKKVQGPLSGTTETLFWLVDYRLHLFIKYSKLYMSLFVLFISVCASV